MTEALFGTAAPLWAATASPNLGWFPAPILATQRSGAVGMATGPVQSPIGTPLSLDPPVIGSSPMTPPVTTLGGSAFPSGFAIAQTPLATSPYPTYISPEMSGVTAPALLATVALRRGQPLGPTNDQEIEDFIYDALDLLPGTSEIDVRSESGRVLLTGSVQQKRLKRDAGEIVWAIPGVNDVQNNVTIVARRRSRQQVGRETVEPTPAATAVRKQS